MTTSEQQAVPVAQEEADAERIVEQHCEAWRWGPFDSFSGTAEWGLAVHSAAQGIATARQQFEQALAKEAKDWRHSAYSRATFAALSASLPCKSGGGAGVAIPADIAEHVLSLGRAEWGQTHAHDAEGHGRHVADSVRITAANFGQDGDQHMHGLWLAGTETVLCHTGTSPNAPKTTQALVGAWNWLVDQASGVPAIDATQTREAELVAAAQEAHDTLHECTAVLTASDCKKVAATMTRLRAALNGRGGA